MDSFSRPFSRLGKRLRQKFAFVAQKPRSKGAFFVAGLVLLAFLFGLGEWAGWPFLAGPVEKALSQALNRPVSLRGPQAGGEDAPFRVRFLGSLRLQCGQFMIAGPSWRQETPTLLARQVDLALGYPELWRAWRQARSPAPDGKPAVLAIRRITAEHLQADFVRNAQGQATWIFTDTPDPAAPKSAPPQFGLLRVNQGTIHVDDALSALQVDAVINWQESTEASVQAAEAPAQKAALRVEARGAYRRQVLFFTLTSNARLSSLGHQPDDLPIAVQLAGALGKTRLSFAGAVTGALNFEGKFTLSGPSLAAAGDPFGVVLPTTGAFQTAGNIRREQQRWIADFSQALVGKSQLGGHFVFDQSAGVPRLSGELTGSRLYLSDLLPAIGGEPSPDGLSSATAPTTVVNGATKGTQKRAGQRGNPKSTLSPVASGRMIPDRPFDLPALRAMNADVNIRLEEANLGAIFREPLRPLTARLQLQDGKLAVSNLDARAAQGRLQGSAALDGAGEKALWEARLRLDDARLERWIKTPTQSSDAPAQPLLAGSLQASLAVNGQGRSTAEILSGLNGEMVVNVNDGSISRLALAKAGLDVAKILGIYLRGGDAPLAITCVSARIRAKQGILTLQPAVVDTEEAALWISGQANLGKETLDLALSVAPKTVSLASLRTPVLVQGSFAAPRATIDPLPVAGRVAAAAGLALLNPAAAILPFIDLGNREAGEKMGQQCRAVRASLKATPVKPEKNLVP